MLDKGGGRRGGERRGKKGRVDGMLEKVACSVIKSKIPSVEEPDERVTNGYDRIDTSRVT